MKSTKRDFVRYVGVGGVAFLADFTLLAGLLLAGLHYLPAVSFAFFLGTWVNYELSVRWVFRFRAFETRGAEFGLFLLVGIAILGVSLCLMALLVEWLSMNVLLAKCLVTVFAVVANFSGRRALLFTPSGRPSMVSSAR